MVAHTIRWHAAVVACLWTCAAASPALAQSLPAAVTVTPGVDAHGWISPTTPVPLVLNRAIDPAEGRLAVVLGTTDWRGQVRLEGTSLVLRATPVPLPSGEHDVVVYLVGQDDRWQEVGRLPLRVLTAAGFERSEARPSLVVGLAGQLRERFDPAGAPAPRDTYQDLTARIGLQTRHERRGWSTTSQVNVVGVSFRQEALRYSTERDEAPLVDLADYQVAVAHRRARLSVGHTTWQAHRFLAQGFTSRGLAGDVALGAATVSLAVLNGSSIVGAANPFGLADRDHRVVAATLGLEAVPARPGRLRVAVSFVDGSVLPRPDVNQGAVQDAETSRGAGVQVQATDADRRLRLDGGLAWSRFVNPIRPSLDAGPALVPAIASTRAARYLDASYALLSGVGRRAPVTLVAGVRYTRADPLFRSIAAATVADLEQRGADVSLTAGSLTSQLSVDRSRDNLGDLASVLTTRTRAWSWTTAAPLGSRGGWAAPTLSYARQRTHQFGEGLPTDSLFDSASQVPDQVSDTHGASITWQGVAWRGGFSLQHASQDNRQPGRDRADFTHVTHAWSVGLSPTTRFDAAFDMSFERATALETDRRNRTRRLGASATWRPASRSVISGAVSRQVADDDPRVEDRRDVDLHLQVSQAIGFRTGAAAPAAQVFIRFARQANDRRIGDARTDLRRWVVTSGLTLTVF